MKPLLFGTWLSHAINGTLIAVYSAIFMLPTWSRGILLSRCPPCPPTCCRDKGRAGHVMFRGAFIVNHIVMTRAWHRLKGREGHRRCWDTQVVLVTEKKKHKKVKSIHLNLQILLRGDLNKVNIFMYFCCGFPLSWWKKFPNPFWFYYNQKEINP